MRITHGLSSSPVYQIWKNMISKCTNKNNSSYSSYGGRGISVCDRWRNSPQYFIEDMGLKPASNYSLGRINKNGNYEPNNCQWSIRKGILRNRKGNRFLNFNGEIKSLSEWCELLNLSRQAIWNRLNNGWTIEKAFTTPIRSDWRTSGKKKSVIKNRRHLQFLDTNGEMRPISELSKLSNLSGNVIRGRLYRGWPMEKALTLPVRAKDPNNSTRKKMKGTT